MIACFARSAGPVGWPLSAAYALLQDGNWPTIGAGMVFVTPGHDGAAGVGGNGTNLLFAYCEAMGNRTVFGPEHFSTRNPR